MEYNSETKKKSRNLGIYQFFEILQLEAIVADLRSKIYPRIKDKNYWKKVYEYKRKTTSEIAERNKIEGVELPTIFSDEEVFKSYSAKIFGDGGYPMFLYKDKEQELQQSYYDSQNYYAKGADVLAKVEGEVKIGVVKYYQPNSSTVTVDFNGSEKELDIKLVTRIL